MDPQLLILIELQAIDARIAALEAEAARLPKQIDTINAALADAKTTLETLKAKADGTRKDLRTREKDLDVVTAKRAKAEARLWEVKNNTEYSAVLVEIEAIKQEKAKGEEEILGLMELQERLVVEVRDAEARLKTREEQAQRDETVVRARLAQVEAELAVVHAEREARARELPRPLLVDYEKILRGRSGLAVVAVNSTGVCGGCRVAIRPQAVQEIRHSQSLIHCESCGRYLYWQD